MNTYRIKLARGDQQFEAEGDKKFVIEMITRFWSDIPEEAQKYIKPPEKDKKIKPLSINKSLSAGEYIRQFGFKKHTDLVLAFGYYLEKHVGLKEFAPADINKCYYDAKMESSNTSQMIIQNIKSGRIMVSKKGGRFYTITQTGMDYIEKKDTKKNA